MRTRTPKPSWTHHITRALVISISFGAVASCGSPDVAMERLAPVRQRIEAALRDRRPTLRLDIGEGVTLDLVLIQGGTFEMGPDFYARSPAHTVTLTEPYYLGRTEVTRAQWRAVLGDDPYVPAIAPTTADSPVGNVSWDDAERFCALLGLRLPSEAEWEFACRAGTTTAWSWGDDPAKLTEFAWTRENSDLQPHPVGTKAPNALGLHDMHGNVSEWCSDWWAPYSADQVTNPTGPDSPPEPRSRVQRGGRYTADVDAARSRSRETAFPQLRREDMGFRVAASIPR